MLAFMHAFKSAITRDTARFPPHSSRVLLTRASTWLALAEVCYQVMRIFDVRHPRLVALGNAILQISILCSSVVGIVR